MDILAHSMGGMVASTYIRSDETHSRNHVHRLITVGTPYLGTPQAAAAHTKGHIFDLEKEKLYGFIPFLKFVGLGTFDVDWPLMLQMARNLTTAYTLLPSQAYFGTAMAPESAAYLQDLHGDTLEDYDATFEFVTAPKFKIVQDDRPLGLGRNGNLWATEQQTVHNLIDDWRNWEGPPQIFRIVGDLPASTAVGWQWDPRLAQRWEQNRNNFQRFLDRFRDIGIDVREETGDTSRHIAYRSTQSPYVGPGDKTVALVSATLGRSGTGNDFSGVDDSAWIEEFEHFPCGHVDLVTDACRRAFVTDTTQSLARVTDILQSGYRVIATPSTQSQATQGQPGPAPLGWDVFYVSGTMPVTVHVEDTSGNHTGPATPTSFNSIEYDVPGILYYPNDFATSLALGRDETYTLTVEAPVDTASLEIIRIIPLDNGEHRNVLFPSQEVAIDGGLRLVLASGDRAETAPLEVDADGDGSYEGTLAPAAFLTSPLPAPAVPAPEPLSVAVTANVTDTADVQVQIALPDVGGPAWQWQADSVTEWVSLDRSAGQTPDTLVATLASTSLLVGTHLGSVNISFSFDGYQLDYLVDITLEIVASGDEVCGDQNSDGVANVLDVIIDLQIATGRIEASADQERLSDLNRDGAVNVFDAIRGLQNIVGRVEATECGPLDS